MIDIGYGFGLILFYFCFVLNFVIYLFIKWNLRIKVIYWFGFGEILGDFEFKFFVSIDKGWWVWDCEDDGEDVDFWVYFVYFRILFVELRMGFDWW